MTNELPAVSFLPLFGCLELPELNGSPGSMANEVG